MPSKMAYALLLSDTYNPAPRLVGTDPKVTAANPRKQKHEAAETSNTCEIKKAEMTQMYRTCKSPSRVRLFATPWTSPSGFSVHRILQARMQFPSAGDLSTQGLNPCLLHCRQIPYHLSQMYKKEPVKHMSVQARSGMLCAVLRKRVRPVSLPATGWLPGHTAQCKAKAERNRA